MEYLLIIFVYISLFISFFWLHILFLVHDKPQRLISYPSVTLAIPAYNEEKNIARALTSIKNLDYPSKKIQVIVVNDGSTDNTASIAKQFNNVTLLFQKHSGMKAAALNTALRHAKGELFACLDADSFVMPDALQSAVRHFSDPAIGCVISAIKVHEPKTFIEKLQHFEYLMAVLVRKILGRINALFVTPGVLSIYRAHALKTLGGFDEGNLTEDYEIALRLHQHHYNIAMETQGIGYTIVPSTWKGLAHQRIRWFRGFIINTWSYKKLLFSKQHGILGNFQLPIAILGIGMLLIASGIIGYRILNKVYGVIIDIFNLGPNIFRLVELPTLSTFLAIDYTLLFPIIIGLTLSIFFLYKAKKETHESFKYPVALGVYFIYYSFMLAACWTTAIIKETFRTKKRW